MLTLTVTGMDCDHCVQAVTAALATIPDCGAVQVSLADGQVTLAGSPDAQLVRTAILDAGYGVA